MIDNAKTLYTAPKATEPTVALDGNGGVDSSKRWDSSRARNLPLTINVKQSASGGVTRTLIQCVNSAVTNDVSLTTQVPYKVTCNFTIASPHGYATKEKVNETVYALLNFLQQQATTGADLNVVRIAAGEL